MSKPKPKPRPAPKPKDVWAVKMPELTEVSRGKNVWTSK